MTSARSSFMNFPATTTTTRCTTTITMMNSRIGKAELTTSPRLAPAPIITKNRYMNRVPTSNSDETWRMTGLAKLATSNDRAVTIRMNRESIPDSDVRSMPAAQTTRLTARPFTICGGLKG